MLEVGSSSSSHRSSGSRVSLESKHAPRDQGSSRNVPCAPK